MPSASWLAIDSIIVNAITTLAAPTVALLVAARMSQPKPTPDTKNPKNRTQRIGGRLIRISIPLWIVPLLGALFNICILPYEIHHANPVTGQAVFRISLVVTGIFYNLVLIYFSSLDRVIGKIIDLDGRRNETISRMVDIEGSLIERIEELDMRITSKETL